MDPIPVILVVSGVVFLFAALVGGKLKLWKFVDVDVQSSRSRVTRTVSASLGLLLLIVGVAVSGGLLERLPLSSRPLATTSGVIVQPDDNFASVRFVDDFTSDELGSEWQIVGRDDRMWALQPNQSSLLIVTQRGSIWGEAANLKNQFVLEEELPQEDFEVIVAGSIRIQNQQNLMPVALFQDDNNFLEIGYWGDPSIGYGVFPTLIFAKETDGQRNVIPQRRASDPSESPETVFLKIERVGNQYSGYFSFVGERPPATLDDIRWTEIGTHAWINFEGRLSFWADNSNTGLYGGGDPPEVAAEFDFVSIRSK